MSLDVTPRLVESRSDEKNGFHFIFSYLLKELSSKLRDTRNKENV
jgi:hypothetical protein